MKSEKMTKTAKIKMIQKTKISVNILNRILNYESIWI